jgi:6,7-dimethyl-8-ribityllumazine synthase
MASDRIPVDGANHARIGIVASRFNEFVVGRLLDGCLRTLDARNIIRDSLTIVRVPGAFEIPVAAAALARRGDVDAVIALGAVIRGETAHFEYISQACVHNLGVLARETGVPVILGVLTVDNAQQALDRSAADESNKGSEAALTALDMIGTLRGLHR